MALRIAPSLLIVLDVLLAERSVTRAARRLGVTQSAVSHNLRALREHLGDPLLVASPGGMVPTPRALAIAGPLRQAVLDLEAATRIGATFDPARSTHRFVVSTVDYGELVVIPELSRELEAVAPGVDIQIEPPSQDLAERLADGRLDAAIAPAQPMPAPILRRSLGREGFEVLLRRGHPAIRNWGLDTYLGLRHLLIAPRGVPGAVVDDALATRGLTRRVALRVTSFVAAPFIVARTFLCLTAPTGLVETATAELPVVARPVPIAVPEVHIYLYWHARVDDDPAHRWLRGLIVGFAERRTRGARRR